METVLLDPLDEIAVCDARPAGIAHDGIAPEGGFELFPLDCARRHRRQDGQRDHDEDYERPELFGGALHARRACKTGASYEWRNRVRRTKLIRSRSPGSVNPGGNYFELRPSNFLLRALVRHRDLQLGNLADHV